MDKKTLRTEMKVREKEFLARPEAVRAETEAVWAAVEADGDFVRADSVLVYMDIPGEVPTGDFIKKWAKAKRIVLPKVVGEDLVLYEYAPEKLVPGYKGILEPSGDAVEVSKEDIDLALVPGLAFAPVAGCPGDFWPSTGHCVCGYKRMGRGKGFYDRLLRDMRCPRRPIGFRFRFVEDLPTDPWDVIV